MPMANELANLLYYCSVCYGAWINCHGLRHPGEQHGSCVPDSAMKVGDDDDVGGFQSPRHIGLGVYSACYGNTSSSADVGAHTLRTIAIFKVRPANWNCVVHENRLSVERHGGLR